MAYQFKREPLTADEANRLALVCSTYEEKLIVWTLLDTGLRVAELANLTKDSLDWQGHRIMIYGKGGPYGTKSKRRVIPLTVEDDLINAIKAVRQGKAFFSPSISKMLIDEYVRHMTQREVADSYELLTPRERE